jgi:hypothetical protein
MRTAAYFVTPYSSVVAAMAGTFTTFITLVITLDFLLYPTSLHLHAQR